MERGAVKPQHQTHTFDLHILITLDCLNLRFFLRACSMMFDYPSEHVWCWNTFCISIILMNIFYVGIVFMNIIICCWNDVITSTRRIIIIWCWNKLTILMNIIDINIADYSKEQAYSMLTFPVMLMNIFYVSISDYIYFKRSCKFCDWYCYCAFTYVCS
jgi:hypothetical protein